jgi:two-component system cell cycle sensor histidine kinase PleC
MGTNDKMAQRLCQAPNALPWAERWALAREVAAEAARGKVSPELHRVTEILARDPKWEVRREVAGALIHLPETVHGRLAAALQQDANAYVKQAAVTATVRRRRMIRDRDSVSKESQHIEQVLQQLGRQFGDLAAKKAREACTRFAEMVAASIVHDLRSMLTHLKGSGEALIDQASANGVLRRTTTRLQADLEFLERAVQEIGTFSQPLPVERHRERLRDVVADSLALAREHLKASGYILRLVSVRIDISLALTASISRHLVVLALANVLKNAFEALAVSDRPHGKGRIAISARRRGDATVIIIKDNGAGIAEGEVVGRTLFVPGRRNKTKIHSTGYGLPIARRNIEAHGGTLDLQRGQGDRGTVVTITLPQEEKS